MEKESTESGYSISSLREEIQLNERIIQDYLKTAVTMKRIALASALVALFLFVKGLVLLGSAALLLGFFSVRKYNRSMGMAEVYNGITKFLKYMLHRELTGDTSLPSFLA